ncbi:MAG: hypothetical protein ACYTKD_26415 [Planctomycetota bacterium]
MLRPLAAVLVLAFLGCRKTPDKTPDKTPEKTPDKTPERAAGNGDGKSTSSPSSSPRYTMMILNYRSSEHDIYFDLNGKRLRTFDKAANGASMDTSPLVEGVNKITVTFTPRKGVTPTFGSSLEILLSPAVPSDSSPPDGLLCEIDEGYSQYEITIRIKGGVPETLQYTGRDWLAADRKKLVYEERVESGFLSAEYDDLQTKSWDEEGRLREERHIVKGEIASHTLLDEDGKPVTETE